MSGRLSPSCSDQSQLFPLFFKKFLDSQCSVTLLAFWLFVVYKSAEWNKQRCMNLHVSAKMHAQVKTKVKLGIKKDGEGNEGKLELMSCYLCICRSVNAARVRTDATSDLFIPASEWVGLISAPVRLSSTGRTEKSWFISFTNSTGEIQSLRFTLVFF